MTHYVLVSFRRFIIPLYIIFVFFHQNNAFKMKIDKTLKSCGNKLCSKRIFDFTKVMGLNTIFSLHGLLTI